MNRDFDRFLILKIKKLRKENQDFWHLKVSDLMQKFHKLVCQNADEIIASDSVGLQSVHQLFL